MAAMKSLKLYFEQQTIIFLSGCNKKNPTIIRHHYNAKNATISFIIYIPK